MNAHWILQLRKPEGEKEFTSVSFRCSNCRCAPLNGSQQYPIYEYYCHRCGAHMIEIPTIEINEYNDNETYKWE